MCVGAALLGAGASTSAVAAFNIGLGLTAANAIAELAREDVPD